MTDDTSYERDILGATWDDFIIWAVDQGQTTEQEVKTMGISERATFADNNWGDYIEDLRYSYMEQRHFERLKYAEGGY